MHSSLYVSSLRIAIRLATLLAAMCGQGWLRAGELDVAPDGPVADFSLRNCYGAIHSLSEYEDYPLVAVAFLGTDCPLAKLYAQRLMELQREYQDQVAFLAIDANVQDNLTELVRFFEKQELTFPLLADPQAAVADLLGAKRTPEVVLLDAQRTIRYRGRIDDQFAITYQRPHPQRRDLAIAIDELLAGKPVSLPVTEPIGCYIGRQPQTVPHGEVTYFGQVAEILNRRCVECHRAGQLAPFPLEAYEDTIGWGPTILEAIGEERMPPWFADAPRGQFHNDRRLSAVEREQLETWIRNGMPAGEKRKIPPIDFQTHGQIAEPDQVVYFQDEPFQVPASGPIDYLYLDVDPGWTEDKYIRAMEIRPGNKEVVHHIVVYSWWPTREKKTLAVYAPGYPPEKLPEGYAQWHPAGSKLNIVIHYTPNGRPTEDRSSLALKFISEPEVRNIVSMERVVEYDFEIPPGEAAHQVEARSTIVRKSLLLSMMPHMHLRGSAFRYEAIYPGGSRELLLEVPNYDFNWQLRYDLAEPKMLPAGTELICTATYDNSSGNPANPDPSATVVFGRRTADEMMFGLYQIARPELLPAIPPRFQPNLPLSDLVLFAATIAILIAGGFYFRNRFRRSTDAPGQGDVEVSSRGEPVDASTKAATSVSV